ncbi:hypothetical protein INR49_016334 [Caranx melampygus]|nr:hypothetical protein INR49_016334 [Caranx melampygus]
MPNTVLIQILHCKLVGSSGQLLDNHILLAQETHQPFAVACHPAVPLCGPPAPVQLDGMLGHLVLLQHSECPRQAKAQQPTHNLHPNLYVCPHQRVENEIWEQEKKEKEQEKSSSSSTTATTTTTTAADTPPPLPHS